MLYFRQKFVTKSFILSKNLWENNDSMMVVREFTIDKELEPLNVKLNLPLLPSGQSQLLIYEAKESQSIVLLRMHLESAITYIKKLQVLNHIPLTLYGSAN